MPIEFRENHNRMGVLRSRIPQEEEASLLVEDSEDEVEEEAWDGVEVRLFVITTPNQDI